VREVAKRAGVGPALVNYYFGGKSGLFAAIIEQVALDIRERLERAKQQSGPITERIHGFVREFVDAMATDPYLPRLLAEQVLFADEEVIDRFARELAAPNLAEIRNLLTEGIRAGELREVDLKFAVPSMIGACLYFFLAARLVCRLFGLDKITPALADDFAKSTADLLLEGLLLRPATT
jgi:AcrR family transcriptional regulator